MLKTLFLLLLSFALPADSTDEVTMVLQSEAPSSEVFRVTVYEPEPGDFTGLSYDLQLSHDLSEDYFAMVSGASDLTSSRGAGHDSVRVTGDPHGNFATSTPADVVEISRGASSGDWIGSVQIVECLSSCDSKGFRLLETVEHSFNSGAGNSLQQVDLGLSAAPGSRTVPFAGHRGGGLSTADTASTQYGPTAGVRWYFNGSDLRGERYGGGNRAMAAATATAYIVDWGSEWMVQSVGGASSSGSNGAAATGAYQSFNITSVDRANSWVWGSGRSNDDGIGDGPFAFLYALGDGVNQNSTETQVSLGSEYGDTKSTTIFVMEHPDLSVEHLFKPDGDAGPSTGYQELNLAISAPTNGAGHRFSFVSNGCNGTGNAYSRPVFASNFSSDTNLRYWRSYAGQSFPAWFQIVDFGGISQ